MIDMCKKCGAKPQQLNADWTAQMGGRIEFSQPLLVRYCRTRVGTSCRADDKPEGEHLDVTCTVCGFVGSAPCLDARAAE